MFLKLILNRLISKKDTTKRSNLQVHDTPPVFGNESFCYAAKGGILAVGKGGETAWRSFEMLFEDSSMKTFYESFGNHDFASS